MTTLNSAFRTFKRFRLFSAINLFGITLGLICSIVIILYVNFQLSFDDFHVDGERIYRIAEKSTTPETNEIYPAVRIPVGADFKDAFPEVESYVQVGYQAHEYFLKTDDNTVSINKVLYTTPNFFEFFSFNLSLGSKADVLQKNDAVVLSEQASKKLFGEENPVGKKVILNNKNYLVSGVAKNAPNNSHINFDAVLSINPVINQPNMYIAWDGGLSLPTFIKLQKANQIKQLKAKVPDLVWEKINEKDEGSGYFTEMILEPMADIHAKSIVDYDAFGKKDLTGLLTLLFIGIVVLLVAVLNYLFLSNGILSLRFKEFGVKRYLGLNKGGLYKQLLSENLLIFGSSSIIALASIGLLSDTVNTLFNHSFIIPQLKHYSLPIVAIILLLSSAVAYFQLWYITKIVSRNISIVQLTKSGKTQKSLWVTSIQFAATIALIVSIITIYKQLNFINNKDLGFKTENVIYAFHDDIGRKQEALKSELIKIPGVSNISASYGIPGIETTANGYLPDGSDQWLMLNALHVDDNFFETYNLEIINGRTFKKGNDLDRDAFIINETLAKQMQWDNPIGKNIFRNGNFEVVGVVKDFHVASMYERVPPLIITKQHTQMFYTLNIALNTTNTASTIKQLEAKWEQIMPNIPFNYSFLDAKFDQLYTDVKRTGNILMLFAAISILISMLGLFALTVLHLNNKIKEIGVRKVNGASITEVLVWLNKSFVVWVIVAIVLSAPLSYYAMQKWLSQFAYKTTLSWWLFALAGCIAIFIALLTVSWRTYIAARQNPVKALRYE